MKCTAQQLKMLDEQFPENEISYHELASFFLPEKIGTYLDYGCGSLRLARWLEARYDAGHGIDVVPPKEPLPQRFKFQLIGTEGQIPFQDSFFDTVSIIEVIEHVPSERAVLKEIARVMKPGGTLMLTTPHKGLLTWWDPGNWKFDFPTFHRWAHVYLFGNRAQYEAAFGRNRPQGLVGDVSGGRHKHYSIDELTCLMPPNLVVQQIYVSYPAMRFCWAIGIFGRLFPSSWCREHVFGLPRLRRWLSRRFSRTGDQLTVIAKKI